MMASHALRAGEPPNGPKVKTLCGLFVTWRQITRTPNCAGCQRLQAEEDAREPQPAGDETPFDVDEADCRPDTHQFQPFEPAAQGYRLRGERR
jgi:hypothetical protein